MNLIKRTTSLYSLYNNRELIEFTHGKQYFIDLANSYFSHFVYKKTYDVFDADFYRILWESENNKFF